MTTCLTGSITRSLLTLPNLSLGGPSDPIQFNGANDASQAANWGGDQWRLTTASSPWVHGEHLTSARRTNSDITMSLWIMAADHAAIQTNYIALRDAVAQWTFTLRLIMGTAQYLYSCMPSDISLGFTKIHANSLAAPVQIQIPVSPTF